MAEVVAFVAEFESHPDAPEWGRTSFINPEDREVFAPAILAGNEGMVFLCACHDNVGVVRSAGHIYVPAAWMAREFPETATACGKIIERTRAAYDEDAANTHAEGK
jgi:hypothetical protein